MTTRDLETGRKPAALEGLSPADAFRLLFAGSPAPMWIYDRDSLRFLDVNDAAVRLYGWSHDEFLTRTLLDVVHPDTQAEVRRVVQGRTGGIQISGPWTHVTASGGTLAVDIRAHALDFEGQSAVVTAVTEIGDAAIVRAELRAREAELERLSARLRQLAEVTSSITGLRDLPTILQEIADGGRAVIGAHQSVVSVTVGDDFAQQIHSISMSEKYAAWADWNEMPDGTGIYRLVCQENRAMRMTDAELRAHPHFRNFGATADRHPPIRGWLAAPLIARDGRNLGLIQMSDRDEGDFTEEDEQLLRQFASAASAALEAALLDQVNAETSAALQRRTEALTAAHRLARLGTWRLVVASETHLWSDEIYAMFGTTPDAFELTHAKMLGLIHSDDRLALADAFTRTVAERTDFELEVRTIGLDGRTRHLWFEGRPELGALGRVVAIDGICQDITDRREHEDALLRAEKLKVLGQLTGGIAHDFNNLLTVITLNLELLDETLSDRPDASELVAPTLRAARRGAELTNQLLAFARRQSLRPATSDLNDLLKPIGEMLTRTLGERYEVKLQPGPDLWLCAIDRGQLENAVLNLAINARDAMPRGGTIAIETANVTLEGRVRDRDQDVASGDYVMLCVADQGEGIPAGIIDQVFDPFFTTKPIGKGSGLGLSMVYGFTKQSGGTATIFSEEGQGTSVKLFFPKSADAAAIRAPSRRQTPDMPTGTILVVEDNDDVRATAVRMCRDFGFSVLEAASADQALALLDDGIRVDILFADVILGGGRTGIDLAADARERRPGLKVLYTSGYTDSAFAHADKEDQDGSGQAVHLLLKPYRRQQFAEALNRVMESGKAKP